LVAEHHGRIVKVMGDGVLIEFGSAVNAVACAIELQTRMRAANDSLAEGRPIELRIGINLVMWSSRAVISSVAAWSSPSGSSRWRHPAGSSFAALCTIRSEQTTDCFRNLGPCEVKKIAKPVQVYRVAGSRA